MNRGYLSGKSYYQIGAELSADGIRTAAGSDYWLASTLKKILTNEKYIGDALLQKEGKELIKYFCCPCKPTKKNGGRTWNLPHHAPEKWALFKKYNERDVQVELQIQDRLKNYPVPDFVWDEYHLDQEINDRGIMIDQEMVTQALRIDELSKTDLTARMQKKTGLENPNSVIQMKDYLSGNGMEVDSLGKKDMAAMIKTAPENLAEILSLRLQLAKSSVRKYQAMQNAVCADGRYHGMFQFYGGNRTGRWASRLIQMQNLPQNHMKDLEEARDLVKAGEKWRVEVFHNGRDIYCESASRMFGVPVEKHGQNSHLRQKGKTAELALGYGGSVGALKAMGALDMGLAKDELQPLVTLWRESNMNIVAYWWTVDNAVKNVIKTGISQRVGLVCFEVRSGMLFITLPSGRRLSYVKPRIGENRFGGESVTYMGIDATKHWSRIESYGPKFVENIVQAVSRDILAYAMKTLRCCQIVGHVHDELIIECSPEVSLGAVCEQMGRTPPWLPGIELRADGYECKYYKKD